MSNTARFGVFGLMILAIALSRLIEVEVRPPALSVETRPLPAGPDAARQAKPLRVEQAPPQSTERQDPLPMPQAANAARPQGKRTYVVRPGDTLGAISKKSYGTTRHWRAILEANRDVIPNESKMRAGLTLVLPRIPN